MRKYNGGTKVINISKQSSNHENIFINVFTKPSFLLERIFLQKE